MSQTAMVSQRMAKLSEHVAYLRGGGTVIVCDRKTPIARIVRVDLDVGGV